MGAIGLRAHESPVLEPGVGHWITACRLDGHGDRLACELVDALNRWADDRQIGIVRGRRARSRSGFVVASVGQCCGSDIVRGANGRMGQRGGAHVGGVLPPLHRGRSAHVKRLP